MNLEGGTDRKTLMLVLCAAMTVTACSTTWIGQAEEIVAVMIPAASNVIALVAALEGKTVSTQDLQAIQSAGTQAGADLQLIQSLITQYQNADATAKAGILNQIQTAIGTVQANLNGLLASVHIKDAATQAKVTAVIGILLSEVQSLAAIVPIVSGNNPALAARDMARLGHSAPFPNNERTSTLAKEPAGIAHPQAPLSASSFAKSYNATMTAKTGNAELDRAAAGLQVHAHGKVARWGSFGMLK